MAVTIGSARIDERGKISGGAAGDQTGNEVGYQNWYLHAKGWVVIRAKDDAVRAKIAKCMKAACDNNNIGYDQSNRLGLFNAVKNKGFDPAKCTIKTETDCSETVRVCVHYAGITCGDFNTSSQLSVLQKTGKFDILKDAKYTKSSDYLLTGDILVTATKGHTVVVLSDGAKVKSTSEASTSAVSTPKKPSVANYTVKKGTNGSNAKTLQQDLNYLGYTSNDGKKLSEDGAFGAKSVEALIKFQKAIGCSADGIYGKGTYNKMKEALK